MLVITNRPAMLGPSINLRRELHGDEPVPATDITLDGIMLSGAELCDLLNDPQADGALFVDGQDGLKVPAFPQLKPLQLADSFDGATVVLTWRNHPGELRLGAAKVAKVALTPQAGGMTKARLQVQAHPLPNQLETLYARIGQECSVAITDAKPIPKDESTGELALESPAPTPASAPQPDDETGEEAA